jgi:hypothetical protein
VKSKPDTDDILEKLKKLLSTLISKVSAKLLGYTICSIELEAEDKLMK